MSRPRRDWIPGGVYHVFCRGSNRQAIFLYDSDRSDLLGCLAQVVKRYDLNCLAFALLPNHCHYLFKTPDTRLSNAMKELNGRYALRFNRRYKRDAHLFRNRFGAVLQESHEQLLWTARYIVMNPVESGLCAQPDEWPWSSHRATAGLDPRIPCLASDELLSYFADSPEEARRRYLAFVGDQATRPGV
jgi:REP element-mobilizing transposase RayT